MNDRMTPRMAGIARASTRAAVADEPNPYARSLTQHLRNFPAGSPGLRIDPPLQAPSLARPPRGIAGAVPK